MTRSADSRRQAQCAANVSPRIGEAHEEQAQRKSEHSKEETHRNNVEHSFFSITRRANPSSCRDMWGKPLKYRLGSVCSLYVPLSSFS
jgi:hypothetical protein